MSPFVSRFHALTSEMDLSLPGLEIAPLYRPTVSKKEANVFYVDVCSAEESEAKHQHYEHDAIMDLDSIWLPGKSLSDCIGDIRFDWAIASHVLEHVPDPIGWLNQILATMKPGGILSLALPDKRYCFDYFRHDTEVSEFLECWIRKQEIPSTRQIYDFLTNSISRGFISGDNSNPATIKESCPRDYSNEQALSYIMNSWTTGQYLDVHCSVFSLNTIFDVFAELTELGVMNVQVTAPHEPNFGEFFVRLVKLGEPRIEHPGKGHFSELPWKDNSSVEVLESPELLHLRTAYIEAIQVQEILKLALAEKLRSSETVTLLGIKSKLRKIFK